MTDTRMIVLSVVGTGIATITVIVSFVAIIAAGLNDRINDTNANVNTRIDDVNGRIDDVNGRIDAVQSEIRDLRTLLIDAMKRDDPADN